MYQVSFFDKKRYLASLLILVTTLNIIEPWNLNHLKFASTRKAKNSVERWKFFLSTPFSICSFIHTTPHLLHANQLELSDLARRHFQCSGARLLLRSDYINGKRVSGPFQLR